MSSENTDHYYHSKHIAEVEAYFSSLDKDYLDYRGNDEIFEACKVLIEMHFGSVDKTIYDEQVLHLTALISVSNKKI